MVIQDLSGDLHAITHCAENVDDCPSNGGLAASGFSDQTQRLAFVKFETNAINRPHLGNLAREHAAGNRKSHGQILNFEKFFHLRNWRHSRLLTPCSPDDTSPNALERFQSTLVRSTRTSPAFPYLA